MRATARARAEKARYPVCASLVTVSIRKPSVALVTRFASLRCRRMPSGEPRKREPST